MEGLDSCLLAMEEVIHRFPSGAAINFFQPIFRLKKELYYYKQRLPWQIENAIKRAHFVPLVFSSYKINY